MKQTFLVTIEAEDNVRSKEIADALNFGTGVFSLGFNHKNDIILATARKSPKETSTRFRAKEQSKDSKE